MKAKMLLVMGCMLLIAGLCYLKFCRNSNSLVGHISNLIFDNNRIELNCVGLDKSDVDVTWKAEGIKERLIIRSGEQIAAIGNEYGPNKLEVKVADNVFCLGNWKTSNWHSNNYIIYLSKDLNGYKIKFIAEGLNSEHYELSYNFKGRLNGSYRSYYKNGMLSEKGTYKDGLQEGRFYFYYENGKARVTNEYVHGKLHGYDISFSTDGKVEYKTKYINGDKVEDSTKL